MLIRILLITGVFTVASCDSKNAESQKKPEVSDSAESITLKISEQVLIDKINPLLSRTDQHSLDLNKFPFLSEYDLNVVSAICHGVPESPYGILINTNKGSYYLLLKTKANTASNFYLNSYNATLLRENFYKLVRK